MALERTLSIVKPDAVAKNIIGEIYSRFEKGGLKIVASRKTTREEINEAMKRASEQQLKGILGYTTAPNVSIDFNHDPHSSTFLMDQTKVQNGTLVRVMSWYDNEWGFSNRMADTAVAMSKKL